jgi:hypothetical protein
LEGIVASSSTPVSMRPRLGECSPYWSGDDPGCGQCADLDC